MEPADGCGGRLARGKRRQISSRTATQKTLTRACESALRPARCTEATFRPLLKKEAQLNDSHKKPENEVPPNRCRKQKRTKNRRAFAVEGSMVMCELEWQKILRHGHNSSTDSIASIYRSLSVSPFLVSPHLVVSPPHFLSSAALLSLLTFSLRFSSIISTLPHSALRSVSAVSSQPAFRKDLSIRSCVG